MKLLAPRSRPRRRRRPRPRGCRRPAPAPTTRPRRAPRTRNGTSHTEDRCRRRPGTVADRVAPRRRARRGGHERVAALPDPLIHDATDRFAARLLDRVPQVVRLGVPVGVTGKIQPDALAEAVGPRYCSSIRRIAAPSGKSARRTCPRRRRASARGFFDRTGRAQRVDLLRGGHAAGERVPLLPVGAPRVDGDERHERGERLVQPDPFHHRIVTRLPNHWCASSCATTSAMFSSSAGSRVRGRRAAATPGR